jgi:hypothetical protein
LADDAVDYFFFAVVPLRANWNLFKLRLLVWRKKKQNGYHSLFGVADRG